MEIPNPDKQTMLIRIKDFYPQILRFAPFKVPLLVCCI
jgi:hypothetical protein